MKNNELHQRRLQATPRGIGVMCGFYAEKAENATLWDVEGNEVIDFAAGIAVLNTGHRHPKVMAAVEKQLQAFTPLTKSFLTKAMFRWRNVLTNACPLMARRKRRFSQPARKRWRTR